MAVPYIFATATSSIPLSQLDSNFSTPITLGNTSIQLGNTVTTLNNMTLANVTVSSVASTFPNNYLDNSTATLGNATITLGGTTTTVGNLTLTNATISSGSVTITDVTASGNVTLSGGTANGVAYLNGSKVLTTGSALTFDGAYFNANGLRISGSDGSNTIYKASGDFGLTSNAGALTYQTTANQPQVFYVNSAEQMRLTSTGLGIGTTIPNSRLDVSGTSPTISVTPAAQNQATGINLRVLNAGTYGAARIEAVNSATYDSNLLFYTNTNSSTTLVERARIDSSGNFLIGTAAIATNATDGFLYIPTCAGTPTGTPTAKTGLAPMVIDSTNNKMYIYSGGAWNALN